MNDQTTLAELQAKLREKKIMRLNIAVSIGGPGVVAMMVLEDGSTCLSSGHTSVADALTEVFKRIDE